MADPPPSPAAPARADGSRDMPGSPVASILVAVGLAYLGLGALLGVVWLGGGLATALLPTGWLFPAVLVASGTLMALRRRFDVVATLWGGLALAVFQLDVLVHVNALDLRFDDPAAFDATIIVAGLGLVTLLLRPWFRR